MLQTHLQPTQNPINVTYQHHLLGLERWRYTTPHNTTPHCMRMLPCSHSQPQMRHRTKLLQADPHSIVQHARQIFRILVAWEYQFHVGKAHVPAATPSCRQKSKKDGGDDGAYPHAFPHA
jgi:hypothetical protein